MLNFERIYSAKGQPGKLMEPAGECVSANDYALEALRRLRQTGRCWAFVLDGNAVAGVLFAEDLAYEPEKVLGTSDVREYMRSELILVGSAVDSQEAERLLRLSRQNFLAVVERNRPIGIITRESLSRCAMSAIA
jgi:predicted transcriptional regulator